MSKVKIFVSENDIQDLQHDFKYVTEDKTYHWATWTSINNEGNAVDIEIHLGDESTNDNEPEHIVRCCSCKKPHTIGDTIRYTKNYEVYCEGECSDDVETAGSTTLEECWWGEQDNVRRCHQCGQPTVDKYCNNESCEVYKRDEKK